MVEVKIVKKKNYSDLHSKLKNDIKKIVFYITRVYRTDTNLKFFSKCVGIPVHLPEPLFQSKDIPLKLLTVPLSVSVWIDTFVKIPRCDTQNYILEYLYFTFCFSAPHNFILVVRIVIGWVSESIIYILNLEYEVVLSLVYL